MPMLSYFGRIYDKFLKSQNQFFIWILESVRQRKNPTFIWKLDENNYSNLTKKQQIT